MSENRSNESHRFEVGLKRLLRTAYHPPEPRQEFRSSLLSTLRKRQAIVAEAYGRRRRIRRLSILSAAAALAASLLLVLGLTTEPQSGSNAPTVSPQAQQQLADASSDPLKASGAVQGVIEVSCNGGPFCRVEDRIGLGTAMRIRAPEEQAGIEVSPGVRVVLDKGSEVALTNGRIQMEHGLVSVRVADNAGPTHVALPNHELVVQPGSWLGLEMAPAHLYSPGGRPAPDVTLMEGKALVSNESVTGELQTGRTYRLHNYSAVAALNGETLVTPTDDNSWRLKLTPVHHLRMIRKP